MGAMVSIPVYNESGQKVGSESIDEKLLGGEVNAALLKQALVMYHANRRQGHAVNKGRGEVAGSTRKVYRQKGTGRARRGAVRTPIMKGGGRAFAKRVREHRQVMPRKMRRLARNNAVLAKIQSDSALIVDGLRLDGPKTARVARFLKAVQSDGGCVLATGEIDENLYKSGRNIPRTDVTPVAELNAHQILARKKLIFTREAFVRFCEAAAATGPGGA